MKFIVMIIFLLSQLPGAFANGGPAALDEIILHQKSGIEKAKEARRSNQDKDLNRLLDDLISANEKELKRLNEMRERLFKEGSKSAEELSGIGKDFSQEIKKMEGELQSVIARFRSRMTASEMTAGSPKVEVKETSKEYEVRAEVPGMNKDDITVKVVQNKLHIEGSRQEEIRQEEGGTTSTEFEYGEFKRIIPLDEKVDPSSIKTDYKDGILMIHLNKAKY